jgi:hypothetical protein
VALQAKRGAGPLVICVARTPSGELPHFVCFLYGVTDLTTLVNQAEAAGLTTAESPLTVSVAAVRPVLTDLWKNLKLCSRSGNLSTKITSSQCHPPLLEKQTSTTTSSSISLSVTIPISAHHHTSITFQSQHRRHRHRYRKALSHRWPDIRSSSISMRLYQPTPRLGYLNFSLEWKATQFLVSYAVWTGPTHRNMKLCLMPGVIQRKELQSSSMAKR